MVKIVVRSRKSPATQVRNLTVVKDIGMICMIFVKRYGPIYLSFDLLSRDTELDGICREKERAAL